MATEAPPEVALQLPPVEKEHMFEKVVTPSDVGKLNRLVIPKQHAERHFPLDPASGDKGLLLSFEDRCGKHWRFRYSYWNSSQSYVMTKGWSRFVRDKKLDAGDTVAFARGVGSDDARARLFIDWRRRPEPPRMPPTIPAAAMAFARGGSVYFPGLTSSPAALYGQPMMGNVPYYGGYAGGQMMFVRQQLPPGATMLIDQRRVMNVGAAESLTDLSPTSDSAPSTSTSPTSKKRLRLFGVNLDGPGTPSRSPENAMPSSSLLRPPSRGPFLLPLGWGSGGAGPSSTESSASISPRSSDDRHFLDLEL